MPLGLRCLVSVGLSRLGLCIPFCIGKGLVRSGRGGRGIGRLHRLLRGLVLGLRDMGICLFRLRMCRRRSRLGFLRLGFEGGSSFVRLVVRRRVWLFGPILRFCRGSILCRFFRRCRLGIFFGMSCLGIGLLGFCL